MDREEDAQIEQMKRSKSQRNGHHSLKFIHLESASQDAIASGAPLAISREKEKHLRLVLRLQDGDPLRITNGRGEVFAAVIQNIGPRLGVVLSESKKSEVRPQITLHLGFARNSVMDTVVEKITELGAAKFVPFFASRSIVKPQTKELQKYSERWTSICVGALEQSEGSWLPEVAAPMSWQDWKNSVRDLNLLSGGSYFFSSFQRQVGSLAQSLAQMRSDQTKKEAGIHLVIGPEGGFSRDEENELETLGFSPLSLGKRILRVETAAVAAMVVALSAS